MSAPIDIAEVAVASLLVSTAVSLVVTAFFGRWRRQVDARLSALESTGAAREGVEASPEPAGPALGSVDEARWIIGRVREVHGVHLSGDRLFTVVRQVLGVAPRHEPGSDREARRIAGRSAYTWCADYLDEVRGGRTDAPVSQMLAGIARTFRRRASGPVEQQTSVNPHAPRYAEPGDPRLVAAARNALSAYRGIYGTGCWNERDRRAFAELAAALEEAGQIVKTPDRAGGARREEAT